MSEDTIISFSERLIQTRTDKARRKIGEDFEAQKVLDQVKDVYLTDPENIQEVLALQDVATFLHQSRLMGSTALPSCFHLDIDSPAIDAKALREKVAAWKKQDWDGLRHIANFPLWKNEKFTLYEVVTEKALEGEALLLEEQGGKNMVSDNRQGLWHRLDHDKHHLLSLRDDTNKIIGHAETDEAGTIVWAEDAKARTFKDGPSLAFQNLTQPDDIPYETLNPPVFNKEEPPSPVLAKAANHFRAAGCLFFILQRLPNEAFVSYVAQMGEKAYANKLGSFCQDRKSPEHKKEDTDHRMRKLYPNTIVALSYGLNSGFSHHKPGYGPDGKIAPIQQVASLVESWMEPHWLKDKISGDARIDPEILLAAEGKSFFSAERETLFDDLLKQFLAKEGMTKILSNLCNSEMTSMEKRNDEVFLKDVIADLVTCASVSREGKKLAPDFDLGRLKAAIDPKISYEQMRTLSFAKKTPVLTSTQGGKVVRLSFGRP